MQSGGHLHRQGRVAGTIVLAMLCSGLAPAQPQGNGSRARPSTAQTGSPQSNAQAGGAIHDGLLTETKKDYLISAGDVVEVWVEDAPELSRNYRVNAAGEFPMRIVGRVLARQKTAEEVGQLIATRLEAEEYLNKPNVVVTVRQYNSQTFIIQGSVNKPGIYQLEGSPDMLTLIGLAGGLQDAHGSTAFILRTKQRSAETPEVPDPDAAVPAKTKTEQRPTAPTNATPVKGTEEAPKAEPKAEPEAENANAGEPANEPANEYELIRVNLSALYKGHFEHNQTLQPRDIVNIPRADVFFVAGEVVAPGSFPLKDGTTLRQAISLAQGLTFKAKAGRGIIFREDPDTGKRQEVKVDIAAVMNGKQEDLAIAANDVIIVPNSRTKSISGALLQALGTNAARLPVRY